MQNREIRMLMYEKGVRVWQLAEALGVCEMTLTRMFRRELSEEQQKIVLDSIQKILDERGNV